MSIWDRISRTLDELSEDFLPDSVRDQIEGARELLARGQPGAAAAALEQALREKPDHATALYLLGVAYLRTGDAERASSAFQRASQARASFGEALVGLGEARLVAGDAASAIPTVRAALALGGGSELLADAYRVLGRAYLKVGAADKGVRELRKALAEEPNDLDAALALAEALLADPAADPEEARPALERAARGEKPPAAALAALGRIQLRAGELAAADESLRAALGAGALAGAARVDALAALADVLARRGDDRGAHEQLLQALALSPTRADLHARLGDVHRAIKNWDAALGAYDRALSLGAPGDLVERALDVATAAGELDRAADYAARLLAARPDHPRALVARDVAAAAARLASDAGAAGDAVAAARAALARWPSDPQARALLVSAGRARAAADAPVEDLYALARRVHALIADAPDLGAEATRAPLAAEVARTIDSYDRPLLVTVMGEFSSGKSTFVNAFLGAEVAPVGITPTTATINVLKYGRERGGRIVYKDDRVREIAWDDVPRVLRAVDASEASRIRFVEVLYPNDTLGRVNLVDTPGLNSILPEHEATARGFVAQADAVIWLFTVGQAGKATERETLQKIRAEGKRVLGVLNKIDQASPDEVARIAEHVRGELGEWVETLVPVSARRALAARKANDAAALADSAWPTLDAALEDRFFRQARALKRDACSRRLAQILARAHDLAAAQAEAARRRTDELAQGAAAARADAVVFARQTVVDERRALSERVASTYRAAAREVLELVRPRKIPFGSHKATGPDRDFLIGFLDRELRAAIEPTRRRVDEDLRKSGRDAAAAANAAGPEAAAELARAASDWVALVDAAVFDRCAAFLRGYLRGGRIDEFFARALPKIDLSEDSVYHALVRDAPDLEAELAGPLASHGESALRAIAERLDRLSAGAELARIEAEEIFDYAVTACDDARRRLERA